MNDDQEVCAICGRRFRWEDAIGTSDSKLVHARCMPKTPRFGPDEDFDDSDDDLPEGSSRA
jgi:hypothetical protein